MTTKSSFQRRIMNCPLGLDFVLFPVHVSHSRACLTRESYFPLPFPFTLKVRHERGHRGAAPEAENGANAPYSLQGRIEELCLIVVFSQS